MLYIMRRTQLYLEDDLWKALHARARREKTTVSELVRRAAREQYLGHLEDRKAAMAAFVGMGHDPAHDEHGLPDSTELIRNLRRGGRLTRLESLRNP
jgi:Ribbon-helix-helix protein, copG family